jgi:predicted ATPase
VRYLFERTASRLIEMRSKTYLAARSERHVPPTEQAAAADP